MVQKLSMRMNVLEYLYRGLGNIRITPRTLLQITSYSYLALRKSWRVISKTLYLLFIVVSFNNNLLSQEKYEGLIVSVESEIVTTYDLSQRIKLALKSLNLDDTIVNRDTVRERVLELLILEKIKKIESKKNNLTHTDKELVEFTSVIYNFPTKDFEDFKSFLKSEGFDIDILMEQMASELLWKKYLQKNVSPKIVISEQEIQTAFDLRTQNKGKYEYAFLEVTFLNEKPNNWEKSLKRLNNFLTLLEKGISFENLSNKFTENYRMENLNNKWVLEDNINEETKLALKKMKVGDVLDFKTSEGYKLVKLNDKRFFGNEKFKYSFLHISSFDQESLNLIPKESLSCKKGSERLDTGINITKFEEILLEEMNELFKNNLNNLEQNQLSKIIEDEGKFFILKLCDRKFDEKQQLTKEDVEKQIYSKKFNQIANTLVSNLRQNINIKYFNK